MPTTPNGVPYPADTDHVIDGNEAIQAVAEHLDSRVLAGFNVLALRDGGFLTLTANAVTVTRSNHTISANAGNAPLRTINGATIDGQILILSNFTGANITVETTGNIIAPGTFLLATGNARPFIYLAWVSKWVLIGYHAVPAGAIIEGANPIPSPPIS